MRVSIYLLRNVYYAIHTRTCVVRYYRYIVNYIEYSIPATLLCLFSFLDEKETIIIAYLERNVPLILMLTAARRIIFYTPTRHFIPNSIGDTALGTFSNTVVGTLLRDA